MIEGQWKIRIIDGVLRLCTPDGKKVPYEISCTFKHDVNCPKYPQVYVTIELLAELDLKPIDNDNG